MADDKQHSNPFAEIDGYTGLPDDEDNLAGWSVEHLLGQVNNLIDNSTNQDTEVDTQRGRGYLNYLGTGIIPTTPRGVLYQDRLVFATIERMQRKILGVFNAENKVCRFMPTEDYSSQTAEQDTAIANRLFFQDNNGIDILKQAIQTGLIAKTGVIREYIDEHFETTEEVVPYGLTREQFNQAMNIRLKEQVITNIDTDDVVDEEDTNYVVGRFKITRSIQEVKFTAVKPEDLLIPVNAVSLETAKAISIRVPTTASDLLGMGISSDKIEQLNKYDSYASFQNNTQLGRDSLDNVGQSFGSEATSSWETEDLDVYESFLRTVDATTGEDVLIRILHGGENGTLLFAEIVEDGLLPIFTWCPYPIAGRFYGQSVADLLSHHQTARTILMRSVLDTTASSNTRRILAKPEALEDIGDITQNKSGGTIRVKDGVPLQEAIQPLPQYTVAAETFTAFDVLEKSAERDSGSPRSGSGVDEGMLQGQKAASLVQFLTLQGTEAVAEMAREVANKLVAPLMYRLVYRFGQVHGQEVDEMMLKRAMQVAVALTPEERTVQAEKMLAVYDKFKEYAEELPELEAMFPKQNKMKLLRDACIELIPSAREYINTVNDEETLASIANIEKVKTEEAQAEEQQKEFNNHIAQEQIDVAREKNAVEADRISHDTARHTAELKLKLTQGNDQIRVNAYKAETERKKLEDSEAEDIVEPVIQTKPNMETDDEEVDT